MIDVMNVRTQLVLIHYQNFNFRTKVKVALAHFTLRTLYRLVPEATPRVAKSEVKYPTPTPAPTSKISDSGSRRRLLNIKGLKLDN